MGANSVYSLIDAQCLFGQKPNSTITTGSFFKAPKNDHLVVFRAT